MEMVNTMRQNEKTPATCDANDERFWKAENGTWTHDPFITSEVLYQLSYFSLWLNTKDIIYDLWKKGKSFCAFLWKFLKKQENLSKTGRKDREYEAGSRFEIWGEYDIMSVNEPEACLHGYGERRMAIMNEVHDIMIFADPLFCFYFIFFTAVDSISLIRFSWFTSEAPGS